MVTTLKIARITSGIKQWRIASLIGINQAELSLYETGRRSCPIEVQKKLAEILSVDVDKLFPKDEKGLS